VSGYTEFSPKAPIIWDKENKLMAMDSAEEELLDEAWEDGDTPETNIDGLTEYAYGFWFRYLTTYPQRLVKKPQWLQLARFSSNEEVEDAKNMGDRTLAVFIGAGFYHFTTYNLVGPKVNVFQNVPYDNHLEGVWSFIHYSFD
jgi:hypothetical protein